MDAGKIHPVNAEMYTLQMVKKHNPYIRWWSHGMEYANGEKMARWRNRRRCPGTTVENVDKEDQKTLRQCIEF